MKKLTTLAAFVMPAVFLSGQVDRGIYEVSVTLFAVYGNVLAWTLTALTVFVNLRVPWFWCGFLCPVAAVTGVLARQEPAYVSRYDCPMENKIHLDTTECLRRNRCRHRAVPAISRS